jgi:peptidyl-tRNA hydrolase, PTH1 family
MANNDWHLLTGLGNPGREYAKTRHNAGFMVIDELAADYGITLSTSRRLPDVIFGRGKIKGVAVMLAKPTAFMNRSGPPIRNLVRYFNLSSKAMLVIHDDIDLALGRIKIITKGGHGGHKGIKSIFDAFGENEFTRIRIGIGRSEKGAEVADHVLGKFSAPERLQLDQIIAQAGNAAVTILCKDTKMAMNEFNRK